MTTSQDERDDAIRQHSGDQPSPEDRAAAEGLVSGVAFAHPEQRQALIDAIAADRNREWVRGWNTGHEVGLGEADGFALDALTTVREKLTEYRAYTFDKDPAAPTDGDVKGSEGARLLAASWGMRDADRNDIKIGQRVRVVASSYGARKVDVGRTGRVVDDGAPERAAVHLDFGNGQPRETRRIAGRCLRILTKEADQ